MENQILEKILNEVVKIHSDISSMKSDISSMKTDISLLQSDMSSVKSEIVDLNSKVDRHSIILEKIDTKLITIAEVQQNHYEQNQRAHDGMMHTFRERFSLVERALSTTSAEVHGRRKNSGRSL